MKTSGSYPSLLQGVSQQPPEVRQQGQHAEQINLVPDPVEGLTRRRGTIQDCLLQIGTPTSPSFLAAVLAAGLDYRSFYHATGGQEYMVLMRSYSADPFGASPPPASNNAPPPVIIYNLTKKRFVNQGPDTETSNTGFALSTYGLNAATSVGKFIVFSNKGQGGTITDASDSVSTNSLGQPVFWIRGGAYSRTYQVRFGIGGSVSVTTPNAGVAGAAEAISPEAIAENLRASLAGLGYTPQRVGSHVYMGIPTGLEIQVTDGGDGSLIKGVGNVVASTADLTLMALDGAIVQIGSDVNTCFYMKAVVKNTSGSAFGECVWKETANSPTFIDVTGGYGLNMLWINEGTNVFTMGRPFYLSAPGQVVPKIVDRLAGSPISNPFPTFMRLNRKITYLGMFQDRLLVGSDAAIMVSAAGDYFNFFRASVLTVSQADPFEMIAMGGEDDVIRHGVSYSKNLVLFGDKRQYIISGQQALTPTSANMSIMTTYQQASYCPPVAAGGQIYYARNREGNVAVHQIQPGTYVDSAESFPTSSQIGDYIPANATQLEQVAGSPAALLVRTRAAPQKLYHFHYTDQPDGRKQASWGTWTWAPENGQLMGVQDTSDGLIMIWMRPSNGFLYLSADRLPLNTGLSDKPYLDSMRLYSAVETGTKEISIAQVGWNCSYDSTTIRFLIGGILTDAPGLNAQYPASASSMWVGLPYTSGVELTNPYLKDGQNKAILTGRTVITLLRLSLKNTSGLLATITSGNASQTYRFNGRVLGDPLNMIGKVPISNDTHTVPIGRETREYTAFLAAINWLPLTFVGIEWVGQSYNRTPRAQ